MEGFININVEKLPEGYYLATSTDLQGLVAQGRTVSETLEIARDVARKIIESKNEKEKKKVITKPVSKKFGYQLLVAY
ncbi:hypothetical protein JYT36_00805 [Bacteroidales bacterium AH-315-N07]|nr:hypothetical protein [Bacteroidales bacterium AH-315-N07]